MSFTATVGTVSPGAGTPAGTVQFVIDGANFGSPVPLGPGGTATSASTTTLAAGSHTVTAVYSGDANFTGSTSAGLTQTVSPPITTNNDNFANRTVISGTSATLSGSNSGATKEAGEPNHAGNAGGKSVWWTWTAPSDGTVTIDTAGSSFDTLLAVYTGTSVSGPDPCPRRLERRQPRRRHRDQQGHLPRHRRHDVPDRRGRLRRRRRQHHAPPEPRGRRQDQRQLRRPHDPVRDVDHHHRLERRRDQGGRRAEPRRQRRRQVGLVDLDGPELPAPSRSTPLGSSFDTLLAVYTGSSVSPLTAVAGGSNDDSPAGGTTTSKVTFAVTAGTTYQIAVDGYGGVSGNITLHLNLA